MNYFLATTYKLSIFLSVFSTVVHSGINPPTPYPSSGSGMNQQSDGTNNPTQTEAHNQPLPTIASEQSPQLPPEATNALDQKEKTIQQKVIFSIAQKGDFEKGTRFCTDHTKITQLKNGYDEASKVLDLNSPDVLQALKSLSIAPADIEKLLESYRKLGEALDQYIKIRLERDVLELSGNRNQRYQELNQQIIEPKERIDRYGTHIKNGLLPSFDPYDGFNEEMIARKKTEDEKPKPNVTSEGIGIQKDPAANATTPPTRG